jgi:glucan phosphoethanolaminetransferase (alkaline phosphatase superfamily)
MWIRLGLFLLLALLVIVLVRSKKTGAIVTAIGLVIVAIYLSIIIVGGMNQWQKEKQTIPTENVVTSFIQEINPELNQKITEIQAEITWTDKKIQQLFELKKNFPNQATIINQKIHQWQTLKDQLSQVSTNIHQKVETAYVNYRIDEIQGKKNFSVLSATLLQEANTVLVNAEATKSILEEQIDE